MYAYAIIIWDPEGLAGAQRRLVTLVDTLTCDRRTKVSEDRRQSYASRQA